MSSLCGSVLAVGCIISALVPTHAQNWVAAQIPGKVYNIQQVVASSDGASLLFGGSISLDSSNAWYETNPVIRYSSGVWEAFSELPAVIYTMLEYQDTLLAGGGNHLMDTDLSDDTTCIAYWTGTEWLPFAAFTEGLVRRMRVLDDTLYAVGYLTSVQGQPANGIARYAGGTWEPVGEPIADPYTIMQDIIKFEGRLIAIGVGQVNGDRGVYRLENNVWTVLGGGVQGGLCSAQSIAVYNDEIYVGGQITLDCGNPGQGIMRWDGLGWQPLGSGLQNAIGDNSSFTNATVMVVHNDLLWVGGGFAFAGGIEAKGLATWDGSQWCGVPGTFVGLPGHSGIHGMDFLHDTLFVSTRMVDGDSMNYAAKFIGESYAGPCASEVGVAENSTSSSFSICPNPATTHIRFNPPTVRSEQISVLDALGRIIIQPSGQVTELDVSSWPRGLYTVRSARRPPARFVLH